MCESFSVKDLHTSELFLPSFLNLNYFLQINTWQALLFLYMSSYYRRRNGYDRSRTCVSRVKSPVHSRFATYPDVSYRTRTCIGGLEVPCPFLWTNETQRPSGSNRYSRIQSPECSPLHQAASAQMDSNHPGWFCRSLWPPDPAHEDGQCSSWTNSCGFSVRRYYRVSLLSFFVGLLRRLKNRTRKIAWLKVMVPLAGIAVCVPQPGGLDSNQ